MVKTINDAAGALYQCEECGFHYADKESADKCEVWCRKHGTCNVEITKAAIENQRGQNH